MKYKRALALLLTTACTAQLDHPPPDGRPVHDLTWREADAQVAPAWCRWEARCHPDGYALYYDDDAAFCAQYNTDDLCAFQTAPVCDSPYPSELDVDLVQCIASCDADPCSSGYPVACIKALGGLQF